MADMLTMNSRKPVNSDAPVKPERSRGTRGAVPVPVQSLGPILRERREAMGVTLAEAEVATRIRQKYLAALESDEWDLLPGEVVGRGFLRNYARFLGLPVEDILARYSAEIEGRPFQPRLPALAEPPRGRSRERTWAPPPPADDHSVAPVERSIPAGLIRGVLLAIVVLGVVVLGSYIALRWPGCR